MSEPAKQRPFPWLDVGVVGVLVGFLAFWVLANGGTWAGVASRLAVGAVLLGIARAGQKRVECMADAPAPTAWQRVWCSAVVAGSFAAFGGLIWWMAAD